MAMVSADGSRRSADS